jgi:hypothetical protein
LRVSIRRNLHCHVTASVIFADPRPLYFSLRCDGYKTDTRLANYYYCSWRISFNVSNAPWADAPTPQNIHSPITSGMWDVILTVAMLASIFRRLTRVPINDANALMWFGIVIWQRMLLQKWDLPVYLSSRNYLYTTDSRLVMSRRALKNFTERQTEPMDYYANGGNCGPKQTYLFDKSNA